MPYRPPTSCRLSAKPAVIPSAKYESEVTIVMSENRLVRARDQALRSPNTGAHGASAGRALPRFALTHRLFFRAGARTEELGLYQNSLASQRSILEPVSICSPSQLVHLHGKPYRLFFERELDGTAPISVRVIATIGITHSQKTVSPSSNPCGSDPFLIASSQPSTSVAKLFAVMGPTPITFFGSELERNRINWDRSPVPFFYLPPSVGLLLTVRTRFFCTRDRV